MAMIEVQDVIKEFRQYRRFPGIWGTMRTLFTRQYDVHRAVRETSFSIQRGEAVGYVGPNGAGKSTMIKMLTGVLVPTSGEIHVNDVIPHRSRRENARKMGVVFGQKSQLWWDLPVLDSFELHKHVYQISDKKYKQNLEFCIELLTLDRFIQSPVRQLSLGQRMRAELALSLLHEPDILFLDEPTIGLDVMAKDRIREFLRAVNRDRKVTIILTTHDLRDIEKTCPRILIVNRGTLVYDGLVTDLKSQMGNQRTVKVEFAEDPGRVELPGAQLVEDEGRRKQYVYNHQSISVLDVLRAIDDRYTVVDVTLEEADIEEVIKALYENLGGQVPEEEELDIWSRGQMVTH